jgi:hypothetical protein
MAGVQRRQTKDQGLRRRRNDDFFLFKSKIKNPKSRIINHSLSSLLMPLLSPSAISRRARRSRIPLLFSALTPCGDKSARPPRTKEQLAP